MEVSNNFSKVSFGSIKLSKSEKEKSDAILRQSEVSLNRDKLKIQLLDIFDKHIKEESVLKANQTFFRDDFMQKMYLSFFEAIENTKDLTTEFLVHTLNAVTPKKDEIKEEYRQGVYSLDCTHKKSLGPKLAESLTDIDLPVYKSIASSEERNKAYDEILSVVQNSSLSEDEKSIILARGRGISFDEIAKAKNSSSKTIYSRLVSSIAKMQASNNILPGKYDDMAETLMSHYDLKLDKNKLKSIFLNNAELFGRVKADKIISFIDSTSDLLKIDHNSFAKAYFKCPTAIALSPEYIASKMDALSKNIGIDRSVLLNLALKQPQIFTLTTERLELHSKSIKDFLNIDSSVYAKLFLKQPQILCLRPETISDTVNNISKLLGISENVLKKLALSLPSLLCLKPETIDKNITQAAELLGIDKTLYISSALKQPQLLVQKPSTIAENAHKTAELLEIDPEAFVKSVIKMPSILCQTPDTIANNVKEASRLLEVDPKRFIQAALRQPQLFYQKPQTLFNNVTEAIKKLGIEPNIYMNIVFNQPSLMSIKADSIVKNVNAVLSLLNIDKLTYFDAVAKKSSLFTFKPETAAKKVKLLQYYKEIQGKTSKGLVFPISSDKSLYDRILNYLVKNSDGKSSAIEKNSFVEYLKNSKKIYEFTIPPNEFAQEFIEYAKDFSIANLGKDIFKFKIK